jgi:hypothetical protein
LPCRRTQLLYQEALGKNVTVGIIAVSNPDYDPTQWWRYSDGVREVIDKSIASSMPGSSFIRRHHHPTKRRRKPLRHLVNTKQ